MDSKFTTMIVEVVINTRVTIVMELRVDGDYLNKPMYNNIYN